MGQQVGGQEGGDGLDDEVVGEIGEVGGCVAVGLVFGGFFGLGFGCVGLLGDHGRAGGVDEFGGVAEVVVGGLSAGVEGGERQGRALGEEGGAEAGDAEAGGEGDEGLGVVGAQGDVGQAGAGGVDVGGGRQEGAGLGMRDVREVDMEGEAFGETGGGRFLGLGAFVEEEERVIAACVEELGEAGGEAGGRALGHGQDEGGWRIGEARVADHAAFGEGGGDVEAAEELGVGQARMDAAEGEGQDFERVFKGLARGAGASADREALEACRVDGQQGQRGERAGPVGRGHPNVSATVRSTRATEPASSSGSRRSRWLIAMGAMRRRWSRSMAVAPS